MSETAAAISTMSADEFLAWAQDLGDGERYELVEGATVRLNAERVSHAETKAFVWLALRNALRSAGLDCTAFPDGVSVRVDDRTVREPDAVVHCGPYDGESLFAPRPVVVVEVVSPSSVKSDVSRKLIDYFRVPSILHYLIIYGDEGRVIHHRRASTDGDITTAVLGRDAAIEFSPPGFSVTVAALLSA